MLCASILLFELFQNKQSAKDSFRVTVELKLISITTADAAQYLPRLRQVSPVGGNYGLFTKTK
jgi:hypothetical protein